MSDDEGKKDSVSEEEAKVEESPQPGDTVTISQWEFLDRVPTREDVIDLLESLPPVMGVATVDFADYVQALPQRKKSRVPHPDPARAEQGVKVEKHIDAYTLYMSVAGRIKMAEAAAAQGGMAVSFVPEPVTPTGIPGFLQNDDRIVYREYVTFDAPIGPPRLVGGSDDNPADARETGGMDYVAEWRTLGRKPGMAWVPRTGGSQAAGSNPYEKVETSARGRALAAWGFGVLPGSGVASLEEVTGAGQNRAAMDAEAAGGQGRGRKRESREDLLQRCMAASEELRQLRGISEDEAMRKMAEYLTKQLGVQDVWSEEDQSIRWSNVKDGQIMLLANSLQQGVQTIKSDGLDV